MASPAVEYTYEQHAVANVTPTTLSPPAGTDYVLLQAINGDIRYRLDGGNPTGSIGMILPNKSDTPLKIRAQDAAYAKFVRDDGASAATLSVHYQLNRAR